MSISSRVSFAGSSAVVFSVWLLLTAGGAFAQAPAQKPLLSREGGGVKPNLVVTLDTSRSMDFQHVPEVDFSVSTGASTSVTVASTGSRYVWMHPLDPGPGYYDSTFRGTVPSNPYRGATSTSMLFQMQMRSPDLNKIYYNPELKYEPWIKSDGSRMSASLPTGAPFIPMMPNLVKTGGVNIGSTDLTVSPLAVAASATVVGLSIGTATTATLSKTIKWCGTLANVTGNTCTSGSAEAYYPMVYYRLNKKASGYFEDANDFTKYTFVDINGMKTGSSKGTGSSASWTGLVTLTSFPKYAARTDCNTGSTCTQQQERQNYANWFSFYRSRMLLAQGAIPEAFKDINDVVRLGWGRIHSSGKSIDGATSNIIDSGVRDFNATTRSKFIGWLRNHPGNTDSANGSNFETVGGTPLIASVLGVGEYYKRTDNGGPWSDDPATLSTATHKSCRRSYNMLVTDGYYSDSTTSVSNYDAATGTTVVGPAQSYTYSPTAPYKDGNSNTLADVAMKYWAEDLRGATGSALDNKVVPTADDPAFWQHMTNYMIGLGVDGTLSKATDLPGLMAGTTPWPAATGAGRVDDLWHAAINSRGAYYSAKNPKELTEGVQASLGQTLQRELRESGVATASATLQDGNRKYVPFYKTGSWSGDIQTYLLDANGQGGALVWTAEAKLPIWSNRQIFTYSTDTSPASGVSFTWDTMGSTNQGALGSVGVTYGSTLVDFLRGDRSKEGDSQPFRARAGMLGDFVNSNPVLVKDAVNLAYGSLTTGGSTYAAYLTSKAARTAALFVGGNDGMLHAFKDTLGVTPSVDGTEVFAYVPKAVYSNLSKLTDKAYGANSGSAIYHQYFVDGALSETDAYVKAPSASDPSWRNYLLGSLGAGGRGVFALDVTASPNLDSSAIRWELSNTSNGDLGYTSAPIQVGVLPNGTWVAIFGNGIYSDSGKAVLFVVNLQTGSAQTLIAESSGSNGLGGVGVVRNGVGEIESLYAGDLKGNVWKFNYLASATSKFEVAGNAALFSATSSGGVAQPITQPPVIFEHSKGGKIVLFGTGLLATEADANSTASQSIYGVWDKGSDSVLRPMGRSLMEPRALASIAGAGGSTFYGLTGVAVDWNAKRGWIIDLDVVAGMRVVYPPQVVSKSIALVSVVSPARNLIPCEASVGSGANLLLPVEEGLNPSYRMFDVDGNGFINSSDSIAVGYGTNADGIDAVVRGARVCTGGVCSTKLSLQNTTSQQSAVIQDPDDVTNARSAKDRVWRRIINPPIR